MNIHKKILLFGIMTGSLLLNPSAYLQAQSQQPSLISETSSTTLVRLLLLDFASRPIASSPVTINNSLYSTNEEGVVDVSSIPVGNVMISVAWKGSVYKWPPQTITAKDSEQLITLRMPILASYGLTTPRLIGLSVILIGIIALVLLTRWLKSSYKTYKDNKFHSANPYGHISNHKLKKASKSNPESLSFTPVDGGKPKTPAPTHQPLPATPIHMNTEVKKESVKPPPAPSTPAPAPPAEVKKPVPEPVKAAPAAAPITPAKQAPANPPTTKPASKPLNQVNGEVLPNGIEVHDLTE